MPSDAAVEFYVREDEFVQASYPRHCALEFAMGSWDEGKVLGISLLVAIWVGATPARLTVGSTPPTAVVCAPCSCFQHQKMLDLYLVSDRVQRSFRCRNAIAGTAAGLIATLRVRPSWTAEEFDEWRARLDTLYPTPDALWRGAMKQKR